MLLFYSKSFILDPYCVVQSVGNDASQNRCQLSKSPSPFIVQICQNKKIFFFFLDISITIIHFFNNGEKNPLSLSKIMTSQIISLLPN